MFFSSRLNILVFFVPVGAILYFAKANPAVVFIVNAIAIVPLSALLPQGGPGCSLFVSPDLLLADLVSLGVMTSALAIPASPPLLGLQVHHQVLVLELDAAGAIASVTGTNAITATIGAF